MELYAGTSQAKKWREEVKEFFEKYTDDFVVVNPTDYYSYGKSDHKNYHEIFRFDLHKVKKSDLILVNLNDIRKSVGTCIEVYEAYKSGIPVIGFLDEKLPNEALINLVHPWIYYCVDRIETGKNSMDKALSYIISCYSQ